MPQHRTAIVDVVVIVDVVGDGDGDVNGAGRG